MKMQRDHAKKEMVKLQQQVEELCGGSGKRNEMSYNPFIPSQWRTAILTFNNGHRARAEVLLPGTDKPVWHADLERRLVRDFNKSQPHAVHKVVKIHLLRN